MVRKGEYLERAVVIPGERGPIEGLYHRGPRRPGLLIAPMHPFEEGSMESPIIAELAWAVTRGGHPTLRFNYRGVGASPGRFEGLGAAEVDALDAAEHLARCLASPSIVEGGEAPIGAAHALSLVGVGFGARVVARVAHAVRRVETVVLVSPDPEALGEALPHGVEVVVVIAEREDPRKKRALSDLVGQRPQGRLAVIPGADRSFLRGLVDLGRVVQEAVAPPGNIGLE